MTAELMDDAPTPAADDLVRELRSVLGKSVHVDIANEAADRIEQQAAEIARLRAVVRAADALANAWGTPAPSAIPYPVGVYDDARKELP